MTLTAPPIAGEIPDAEKWAALFGEVRAVAAYKTADEIVNNTAVLQNDDHIVVTVEANATYLYDLFLQYTSGTTPDFKFVWSAPAGAALLWGGAYYDTSGALVQAGGFTLATTGAIGGTGGLVTGRFTGVLTTVSAGSFQLTWAQNAATASNTTLHAGSYVKLLRIS